LEFGLVMGQRPPYRQPTVRPKATFGKPRFSAVRAGDRHAEKRRTGVSTIWENYIP
jgi:hypothetical protein